MSESGWPFIGRVVLKALVLFALCNLSYLITQPAELLGRISLYNVVWAGRERLPYGENPAADYNVTVDNIPAMMASHEVANADAAAYTVFLMGDSNVWGWLLPNEQTLATQLNQAGLIASDGRPMRFYNLGYPIIALGKDLLLLDEAIQAEPDLIIWFTTLEAFPRPKQAVPPIVQNNPDRREGLVTRYEVDFGPVEPAPPFFQNNLIRQRQQLADLIRLQLYGASWQATGIDQAIPESFDLRANDFDEDIEWQGFTEAAELPAGFLATDMLAAGFALVGETPMLLVNEPIFISSGENSELRYNAFYPRWVYDEYRLFLAAEAERNGWPYLDLWDSIGADQFTDSPVHLTAAGTAQLADQIIQFLEENPS